MSFEQLKYIEKETTVPANILIIDELAQFISNIDMHDRERYRHAENIRANIEQIAQLGRSAHIHLILATQSASADLFPNRLRNNVQERIVCGRLEEQLSRQVVDSDIASSIPNKAGAELGYASGEFARFQGYFTPIDTVIKQCTIKDGYAYDEKKKVIDKIETDDNVVDFNHIEYEKEHKKEEDTVPQKEDEQEDNTAEDEIILESNDSAIKKESAQPKQLEQEKLKQAENEGSVKQSNKKSLTLQPKAKTTKNTLKLNSLNKKANTANIKNTTHTQKNKIKIKLN